ncbi:CHAD domain-containing protein [Methylomonas sp. MED-D]|uniref:CHAD domain-containing protein n=1 Tax=unclassified Methylomonas TaxID=2608980 RepID=UPI0028A5466C|nr:CHAD domain-containing protein [Methylomonas sp. MV1]MDT4330897.1 CHAD domain-containing protein [Methylomonas sp. MV1]
MAGAGKFLQHALDRHWQLYRKRLQTCRQRADEDNIHKLRTGIRRLVSVIDLIRALAPCPALRKARKVLKAQLDRFDDLRDTQVMLLTIDAAIVELPELRDFHEHLRRRENRLLGRLEPEIAAFSTGNLRRKLKKSGRRANRRAADIDLAQAIPAVVDRVYADALERHAAINDSHPATIHQLRIALKKLRYMLEAAPDQIPGLKPDLLERLQRYLTAMGDIQNAEVLASALAEFYRGAPPAPVADYFQRQHRQLMAEFIADRYEIFRFWRAAPDQAQPWQHDLAV